MWARYFVLAPDDRFHRGDRGTSPQRQPGAIAQGGLAAGGCGRRGPDRRRRLVRRSFLCRRFVGVGLLRSRHETLEVGRALCRAPARTRNGMMSRAARLLAARAGSTRGYRRRASISAMPRSRNRVGAGREIGQHWLGMNVDVDSVSIKQLAVRSKGSHRRQRDSDLCVSAS